MFSILIVDDDKNKIHNISECLLKNTPLKSESLQTATDAVSARSLLENNVFDLLVLDLRMSERFGVDAEKLAGIDLYFEILETTRLNKPLSIVAVTSHKELMSEYADEFGKDLNALLNYDPSSNEWCDKLSSHVRYMISCKQEQKNITEYQSDIAIITALATPELQAVLRLPVKWEDISIDGDHTRYFRTFFKDKNKSLEVVAASSSHMGMAASGTLATKLIYNFRPRYIVMVGIAAATNDSINYGDVLIASNSYDYGSGKIINKSGERLFFPDPQQIPIDQKLHEDFKYAKMKSLFVDEIKRNWPASKPTNSLEVHIDSIASGSAVVQDKTIVEEIKTHSRKVIGIDMETYSIFYAATHASEPKPKAMSIKSVSDYADTNKSDDYQPYSAYTSANYFYNFALQFL